MSRQMSGNTKLDSCNAGGMAFVRSEAVPKHLSVSLRTLLSLYYLTLYTNQAANMGRLAQAE